MQTLFRLFALLGGLSCALVHSQVVQVTGFGTSERNSFDVSGFQPAWSAANYTLSTTTLSVTNAPLYLGGFQESIPSSVPLNATAVNVTALETTYLQLTGMLTTLPAGDPTLIFSIYDSSGNSLTYDFNMGSFSTTGLSTISSTLASSSGTFNGSLSGYALGLDGNPASPGDGFSFTFDNLAFSSTIAAIPEPRTYGFLILGVFVCLISLKQRIRRPRIF